MRPRSNPAPESAPDLSSAGRTWSAVRKLVATVVYETPYTHDKDKEDHHNETKEGQWILK